MRFVAGIVAVAVVAVPSAGPTAAAVPPGDALAGDGDAEDPIELSVDRAEVDANQPSSTFTVTWPTPIASPYIASVYDDTGRRVFTCTAGQECASAGAHAFAADTPNNAARTYTAFIAQDAPTASPPVVDVRGTSSVSVANLGSGNGGARTFPDGTIQWK